MSIPKIIHQTWKTNQIPSKWITYQKKIIDLHPDWKYKLWTDDDNEKFVQKEYPEFYETFINLPKNIMRADVIRYLILFKQGGLYIDLDYEMIKPFDLLDNDLVLPKNRSIEFGDSTDELGNCIIASIPNHPFWKDVITDLQNNPPEANYHLEEITTTGPLLLTRIYSQNKYNNITTPERIFFHPPLPKKKSGYQKIYQNNLSYGIHHCWGSWIERFSLNHIKHLFIKYFLKYLKLNQRN